MKNYILKSLLVIAISAFSLTGCAENAESSFVVTTFEYPGPHPIEVTVEQLYEEYMADEATANVKYIGKRLLFNEIEVEEVFGSYFLMGEALGAATQEYAKLYFMNGFIRFKPRNFGIMQNIEEGYVLNLVGECWGLQKGFVVIEDCWVESVVGDIGTGEEVDFY